MILSLIVPLFCYGSLTFLKKWICDNLKIYIQCLVQYGLVISKLAITKKDLQLLWESYNFEKVIWNHPVSLLCFHVLSCGLLLHVNIISSFLSLIAFQAFFLPSLYSYNIFFSFQYAASYYFFHLNSTHISFVKRKKNITYFKNHFYFFLCPLSNSTTFDWGVRRLLT